MKSSEFMQYIVKSPGIHVRHSSRRHNWQTLASRDVYGCTELMFLIIDFCDWNSLIRIVNSFESWFNTPSVDGSQKT